jgi:hypothetical protein
MTKTLIIAPAIAAMLVLGGDRAASAQSPWCLDEPGAGLVTCSYQTFAQCQASRPGGSTSCVANPAAAGSRSPGDGSPPTSRERRR